MSLILTRRTLIRASGMALGASLLPASALVASAEDNPQQLIHLNLNENAFGLSPNISEAIRFQIDSASVK